MIQVFIKIGWTKQYKKLHKKSKINILSILNFLLELKEWPETYQIYKADWNSMLWEKIKVINLGIFQNPKIWKKMQADHLLSLIKIKNISPIKLKE